MLFLVSETSDLRLVHINLQFQLSEIFVHFLKLILSHIQFILCSGKLLFQILHLSNFDANFTLEASKFLIII
jgi:hypothetical protein